MAVNTPISFLILIMLAMLLVIILILFNVTATVNQSVENGKKIDAAFREDKSDDERLQNQTYLLLNKTHNDHVNVQGQHEDIKKNATAEIAIGLLQHYNQTSQHEKQFDIFNQLVENGTIVNKTNTQLLINISKQLEAIQSKLQP